MTTDTRTTEIPKSAWTRRFDEATSSWPGSPVKLRPNLLMTMFPALMRIGANMVREKLRGSETALWRLATKARPVMGVPLGGIGGGSITRGWRGDFVRWQLRPGFHEYRTVPVDQFSLWVRRAGEEPRSVVLGPRPDRRTLAQAGSHDLAAWNWNLDPTRATYHALFPRAWTQYREPIPRINLTCRQISPVIPHNYRESSYPVGVFVWTIENAGRVDADVSLMFSFQNGTGGPNDRSGGHSNQPFSLPLDPGSPGELAGVALRHVHRQRRSLAPSEPRPAAGDRVIYEDPLTLAIGARSGPGVEVTRCSRVVTTGRATGLAGLWRDFSADGRLDESADPGGVSAKGEAIGAAVAARVQLPAGGTRELVFVLGWDMPAARFGRGTAWWRRYTEFYGREGDAAPVIARDAVRDYPEWEKAIQAWQEPVLSDPDLPDWYKTTLFNETYYIVDGGTLWTAGRVGATPDPSPPDPDRPVDADGFLIEPAIGHFGYLESHEYLMYNTYDVHFTASFALAMLWPELELSLQRDFANAVGLEHKENVLFLHSGVRAPRKRRGVVPHDLGNPGEDPWRMINAYDAQDVGRWKDLNPKFVLQLWRDYVLTGDRAFLGDVWPAVETSIDYMLQFDRDGDGLIENEGFPDQTYDVWSAQGPSAYSGCLWLACLEAGAAIAGQLGHADRVAEWRELLARAQEAYERALWNGEYYLYDAAGGRHSDSLMADALSGHWFARATGLPGVVPKEHARKMLANLFDLNVKSWTGTGRGRPGDAPVGQPGERGAVNGMRPDGNFDRTCMQSAEVWTGTTFSLAAHMLQEGMREAAFETAKGVYLSVYRDFPLWFQTPEAIDVDGVYRAIGYMRPLAVWAMQWEVEGRHG